MSELRKCPFCGCERIFVGAYDYEEFDDKTYYKAECNSCEAETGFKDSKQEAIAAWNRRVSSDNNNNQAG